MLGVEEIILKGCPYFNILKKIDSAEDKIVTKVTRVTTFSELFLEIIVHEKTL